MLHHVWKSMMFILILKAIILRTSYYDKKVPKCVVATTCLKHTISIQYLLKCYLVHICRNIMHNSFHQIALKTYCSTLGNYNRQLLPGVQFITELDLLLIWHMSCTRPATVADNSWPVFPL
jgi:hypothetical protein